MLTENSSIGASRNYIISQDRGNLLSGIQVAMKKTSYNMWGSSLFLHCIWLIRNLDLLPHVYPGTVMKTKSMQTAYEFTENINIFSGRDGLIVFEERYQDIKANSVHRTSTKEITHLSCFDFCLLDSGKGWSWCKKSALEWWRWHVLLRQQSLSKVS